MENIHLDKYQKKAVTSKAKNLLVIAGAGSGKTLTIIYKIKQLLKNNIKPEEILCITFTKAAAQSLEEKLLSENISLNVKTFHSLGYMIIKSSQNFNLVKDNTLDDIIMYYLNKYNNLNDLINAYFIEFGKGNSNQIKNNILKHTKYIYYLKDIVKTFINLFKSNNYNLSAFNDFYKINQQQNYKHKRFRHKKFLTLVKKIYKSYEEYLSTYKLIDFHDMINRATKIVEKEGIYPYKYIIIDEYQDTSLNKCELLKAIQNKTKASLMAVGDDWQSIYRFTGSNLDIFTNFKQYFPKAKIIKLKKTYRNSMELLKITNKFIMKNPYQIKKKISSEKHYPKPLTVYYYNHNLKEIWDNPLFKNDNKTLILARNNIDKKQIPYLYKNMQFMTIHKSKGLEAEKVILINLENKITSLPSKIQDNEYLMYVTVKEDNYTFAEERRLFYVALTRTKSEVILLVKKNNPSLFVTELLKDSSKYIKIINP